MDRLKRDRLGRRRFLGCAAGSLIAMRSGGTVRAYQRRGGEHGYVVGEPTAEMVGAGVLATGGNAVDAIVAAALAAAIAAPHQTGIGGYGASAVIAMNDRREILAIDGNSAAPQALTADRFRADSSGVVSGRINEFGWLAAGVPGVLAALQLALDHFGSRPFAELVQPAIRLARDGIRWPAGLANMLKAGAAQFTKDPGSNKLYFPNGQPLAAGALFQNPELADLLTTLAQANSVEPFYRGDIAQRIADGFQKNEGLVTAHDLADYRAKMVEPLTMHWDDQAVHTAPLTAGGISVLQALTTLRALNWNQRAAGTPRTHAYLEALRIAWRDRLTLLGDTRSADIPCSRLLSLDYARESADRIDSAVKERRILAHPSTTRDHNGTIHLSAADRDGNFAALTLTHGGGFGARVTVEGLGLTLGHGMSRFEPHPGHPNAPGPGKRPLHNMVPTIVTRGGRPVLAVGGRGGRKIPNAMFELLTRLVVLREPLDRAIAAPRAHTEGSSRVEFEKAWPASEVAELAQVGYEVAVGASATISAVALEHDGLHPATR